MPGLQCTLTPFGPVWVTSGTKRCSSVTPDTHLDFFPGVRNSGRHLFPGQQHPIGQRQESSVECRDPAGRGAHRAGGRKPSELLAPLQQASTIHRATNVSPMQLGSPTCDAPSFQPLPLPPPPILPKVPHHLPFAVCLSPVVGKFQGQESGSSFS